MLDFKEEVLKYKPILETDEVAKAIDSDEIQDVMDLLQHIKDQVSESKRV